MIAFRTILTRDRRIWHVAYSAAQVSTCRYKFGAVIASGNDIISIGTNIQKTHPVFKRYGAYCISIHAEVRAMIKARQDVSGMSLYVARYGSMNTSSYPCSCCVSLIQESGIRFIIYCDETTLRKVQVP